MPAKSKVFVRTVTPGKKGMNIDRAKYELIHDAIIAVLKGRGDVLFADLPGAVSNKLHGKFDGSIAWYTTSVKLDMERRKIIERVPDSRPQRLRIKGKR
jgi:hypothetical protein